MQKAILFFLLMIPGLVYAQPGKENNPRVKETVVVNNVANGPGSINLLTPADAIVQETNEAMLSIIFRWTPLIPAPKLKFIYRLRVWQLKQGQNPVQAINENAPVISKDVTGVTQAIERIITGPCRPPYLCDFVWSVEAISADDGGSGKSLAQSHPLRFSIKNTNAVAAQGDPVHGVDVKLGFEAKSQCDPVHGVDIKLGLIARDGNGDPVHGVDVKLGVVIARNSKDEPMQDIQTGPMSVLKTMNANGDPVHGVDVKLGATKMQGDPVHGVDVKLGIEGNPEEVAKVVTVDLILTVVLRNANGDPVHGVDVKLGAVAKKSNGDPVHGVDVKMVAMQTAQGDPVHGVDVKLGAAAKLDKELDKNWPGAKSMDKELDKNWPGAKSMTANNSLHPIMLPIDKIVYDSLGNIVELVFKPGDRPSPKVIVAGSRSISGEETPRVKRVCHTVYCHNPLHPPGCGWQECN